MVGRPAAQRKRGRVATPRRPGEREPVAPVSARRDNARAGEVAEWLNAAVLKTVDPQGFGGSNPSLSAKSRRMKWRRDSVPSRSTTSPGTSCGRLTLEPWQESCHPREIFGRLRVSTTDYCKV